MGEKTFERRFSLLILCNIIYRGSRRAEQGQWRRGLSFSKGDSALRIDDYIKCDHLFIMMASPFRMNSKGFLPIEALEAASGPEQVI